MLLKQHFFSEELQKCSDEDLIVLFHYTADQKFFSELFSRYADLAYRICLKYLQDIEKSKDQVMHIFSQLLEKCRRQKIKINSFKSWLFTYIRNECSSYIRSQSRYRKRLDSYTSHLTAEPPYDINEWYVWEEQKRIKFTRQKIQQALLQLPSSQRKCLHYFYFEKKSYRNIAKQMGIQLKEVKSHIQNGKRNMKKRLS